MQIPSRKPLLWTGIAVLAAGILGSNIVAKFKWSGKLGETNAIVRNEMRGLKTMLESYYLDNQAYPPPADDLFPVTYLERSLFDFLADSSNDRFKSDCWKPANWYETLRGTHDGPMAKRRNSLYAGKPHTYDYFTDGKTWCLLRSVGPDGHPEPLNFSQLFGRESTTATREQILWSQTFDFAKGHTSPGDFFQCVP